MPDPAENTTQAIAEAAAKYLSDAEAEIPHEAGDVFKAVRSAQMELYSVGDRARETIAGHYGDDTLPEETRAARARETADKADAARKDALGRSQTALAALEQKLTALALPKAPAHPGDLANARDELRMRLDGLDEREVAAEVMAIAGGSERDLAGVLVSSWGAGLLRRHDVDVSAVKAQALRGAAKHGDKVAQRAVKALGAGLLNAKKAHGAAAVAGRTGVEEAGDLIAEAAQRAHMRHEHTVTAEVNRRLRLREQVGR